MAVAQKSPPKQREQALQPVTLEEFFALPEGPPDYELEQGKVIAMPRPHPRHQAILRELTTELTIYLRTHRIGSAWPEIDVQMSAARVYVPDLVFLSAEHSDQYTLGQGRIIGAPDLVVEIVSPASVSRDRVAKFNGYRQAGVPWYWLVDSESLLIEGFRLTPEGYLAAARVAAGEVFRQQLFPDLEINLADLLGERVEALVD